MCVCAYVHVHVRAGARETDREIEVCCDVNILYWKTAVSSTVYSS